MKRKSDVRANCFVIVITILLVSFIINIYQSVVNNGYKNTLKQQNYNRIEEIRYRNESILAILESCIAANCIDNEELLALYKNYTEITETEVELWEVCIDNRYSMKKIDMSSKSNIYWQIEELIYAYLQNDMKENTYNIQFEGKSLQDFTTLLNLSRDLNDYYIKFYEKNCNSLSEEKRKDKMIKEDYWMDIFEGMQEIDNKYINYSFAY